MHVLRITCENIMTVLSGIDRLRRTPEEARDDVRTAKIIIGMLIHKENVLLVLHSPTQRDGESTEQYVARRRDERILAVNPNFVEPR